MTILNGWLFFLSSRNNKCDIVSILTGNRDLCGGAMGSCGIMVSKLPVATIVISVAAAVAAVAAIVAAFVILRRRHSRSSQLQQQVALSSMPPENAKLMASSSVDKLEHGGSPHASRTNHKRSISSSSNHRKSNLHNSTKLTFLRDDRPSFGLSDLLSASAEILGSGVFGSTYKAVMNNGSSAVMVVKKYTKMNDVGREEFQEHVRRLGKLRHPNILPLVAYYFRKEEKLLVSDYVANVSLAVHLHGKWVTLSLLKI